jgi:prevent-host-death family protein
MAAIENEIVNVYEAKTQLSKLLDRVAAGDEVIIGKAGKPVARLVPYETRITRRTFGRLAGSIGMADDFDQTPEWLTDSFEGNEVAEDDAST